MFVTPGAGSSQEAGARSGGGRMSCTSFIMQTTACHCGTKWQSCCILPASPLMTQ